MLNLYLAAVIFSLSLAMLLEVVLPLHPSSTPPLLRWFRNLALSALALGAAFSASTLSWAASRALEIRPESGMLSSLGTPVWAQWVITFLTLDAIAYALHRISHHVNWLWRLHSVHHSDPELDATTTHRHHPVENVITALISLPVLLVLAPPVWAVLTYSMTAVVISTLSHSSLALPDGLDKVLRNFIVTPAYHRTHHSAERIQTDSNYATVLPLFDRLFRSASPAAPDKGRALTIGLETARDARSQSLWALLMAPFRRSTTSTKPLEG
ncbi:sterol desaturase family protein [Ottowia thiooxydans]|uniref:sterol desaturase family protein n=1 Tax=Ottowia thiooxydans TaxID=219182 RepID=UPI00040A0F70|nr:sterol desaturase family protein [Ottowia thiooxydans]